MKDSTNLFSIRQGKDEPLGEYITRFSHTLILVDGCDEDTIDTVTQEGFRNRKSCETSLEFWAEFYSLTQQYVAADEYLSSQNEVELVLKAPQQQPKWKRKNTEQGGRPELTSLLVLIPSRRGPDQPTS